MIGAKDLDDFRSKIQELKVGIPEVEMSDEDHLTVKLYECITCAGFTYTERCSATWKAALSRGSLRQYTRKRQNQRKQKAGLWASIIANSECFSIKIMAGNKGPYENKLRELEITLEEERSLSKARNTLLETNIKELDNIYVVLNEKLKSLRSKDERIKGFEAELVRANKLSSLGELAGSIAHEIKNPLIAIQGFAKRIGKTKDPDKIENYAKLMTERPEGSRTSSLSFLIFHGWTDRKRNGLKWEKSSMTQFFLWNIISHASKM